MDRLGEVIRGLQCTISPNPHCRNCEYFVIENVGVSFCDRKSLMLDALELLKAQEPVEPVDGLIGWRCGHCHARIEGYANFCHNCGRGVKWK